MPNVSVIIPAYNAEGFITDTVRSALDQTYQDLEVIVVDDGSTDGTLAQLESFGPRVRVHRQANSGVARARNTGVGLARGSWIAFLDADDVWLPHKIERQLAWATRADVPMSFTDRFNFGSIGDLPELQSIVTPMRGGDIFVPLMHGNFITLTSVMIQRELFEEMGGFYTGLNGTEDWDLWLRVAEQHPIGFVSEPLVYYRLHEGGLSRNFTRMSRERTLVITRALLLERGRLLSWHVRRQIWADVWRTNGWDAGRAGARLKALADYARAAMAWPLELETYKGAFRVYLNA
jgi:glycosyltransferase involved in cell wall biosynthesis